MSAAVTFDNVSLGYRDEPVLKGISLEIQAGEFAAVIGPNGAGKTTMLRAVTGLLQPLVGNVRLFGVNLPALSSSQRARMVGVVPQDVTTPMSFTVEEIVMIGRTSALSRWKKPSDEDIRAVQRAMVYTDVAEMKDKVFSELSSGERQRAVIAMVLAQDPKVILLDEATSHLDINHRLEVMQIVERLNREDGVTVIMVSHDLNMSAEFCERLVLIDNGRIISDGKPEEVLVEKTLREVYQCDVHVQQNTATGSVQVVPAPRLDPDSRGRGVKVHVVCGGGSGEEVLRRLSLCGYDVTCGVLNEKDTDAEVASALNIETALELPFSPLGQASLERAGALASKAEAVIICGVPFGSGNLPNLDLGKKAMQSGRLVFLMDGIETRDYTEGKDAERVMRELEEKGAVKWSCIADLLDLLPTRGDADE